MTAVLLPATFHNSFWSQDCFRTGLTVLFDRLEQGCAEDREILALIDAQAQAFLQISNALSSTPPAPTFASPAASTTSATLQLTFFSLQHSLHSHSEVYRAAGIALKNRIVEAFGRWHQGHEGRVGWAVQEFLGEGDGGRSKDEEEWGLITDYERRTSELAKLKQNYINKTRAAEDLEEDARFAPVSPPSSASPKPAPTSLPPLPQTPAQGRLSPLPSSPRMSRIVSHSPSASFSGMPSSGNMPHSSPLKRTGTVADRINEKLRAGGIPLSPDRGGAGGGMANHGRSMSASSSKLLMDMAGSSLALKSKKPLEPVLGLGFEALISLLSRFGHYLSVSEPPNPPPPSDTASIASGSTSGGNSRTKKTILGTYENTFTATELVAWLLENVKTLGEDWDKGEAAGEELLKMGMVERIGVKGRGTWEGGSDAYYTLKDAVLDASPFAIEALRTQYNLATGNLNSAATLAPSLTNSSLPSLSTATSLVKSYLPSSISALTSGNNSIAPPELPHVKARREAKQADEKYAYAAEELDSVRLKLEEKIEQGLKLWERWERERTDVVKQVLKQYESIIANLPAGLQHGITDMQVAVKAYKPEADIVAMIETLRTGDFRPTPHVYENIESDEPTVGFGIDLRKQHGWRSPQGAKSDLPPALEAMLQALTELYPDINADQRRKSWIYLVDLRETHMLREALNDARIPVSEMVKDAKRFNTPVIAATVKLWLLELDPPVVDYNTYNTLKSLADTNKNIEATQFEDTAKELLRRLTPPQLLVLDAVIGHLRQLIDSTKTEESNDTFIKKLSLSMGRSILRPQSETELTLQDKTPSRFFTEILASYHDAFTPLVQKARLDRDRPMPQRKRTKPVDARITRRSLGNDQPEDFLKQQLSRVTSPPSTASAPLPPPKSPPKGVPQLAPSPIPEEDGPQPKSAQTITVQPPTPMPPQDDRMPEPMVSPEKKMPSPRTSMASPVKSNGQPQRSSREGTPESTEDEAKILAQKENRPLSSSQSNLKRATSGEGPQKVLRGPRVSRGPRSAPGKSAPAQGSSQPASAPAPFTPGSPTKGNSIKDRIAAMERKNSGGA